ncbi:unnamed protein product [Amoebophrya sp. A25]|nr:unnamed protein product [Amoebophrya sp. A25]|eukprot:GSA25T00009821001.1
MPEGSRGSDSNKTTKDTGSPIILAELANAYCDRKLRRNQNDNFSSSVATAKMKKDDEAELGLVELSCGTRLTNLLSSASTMSQLPSLDEQADRNPVSSSVVLKSTEQHPKQQLVNHKQEQQQQVEVQVFTRIESWVRYVDLDNIEYQEHHPDLLVLMRDMGIGLFGDMCYENAKWSTDGGQEVVVLKEIDIPGEALGQGVRKDFDETNSDGQAFAHALASTLLHLLLDSVYVTEVFFREPLWFDIASSSISVRKPPTLQFLADKFGHIILIGKRRLSSSAAFYHYAGARCSDVDD